MPARDQTLFYLVRVSRMETSDDANMVGTISYIVSEEDLRKPNTILKLSTEALEEATRGAPLDGLRPMTEAEIADWRKVEDGD